MLHLRAVPFLAYREPDKNGVRMAQEFLKEKGDLPWEGVILDFQSVPAGVLISVMFRAFFQTLEEQGCLSGLLDATLLTSHAFQKECILKWHEQFHAPPEPVIVRGDALYFHEEAVRKILLSFPGLDNEQVSALMVDLNNLKDPDEAPK